MERTTITFYDETYQQLKIRAQKNGNQSIAHCVRELVELGLKIEKAASESEDSPAKNGFENMLFELKTLLKSNLSWSLETRLLSRFLIENQPNIGKEKQAEVLEKYKESAQNYVNGLVRDE